MVEYKRYSEIKRDSRRREVALLAQKAVSPMELGAKNFCMKGANLHASRRSLKSFNLF